MDYFVEYTAAVFSIVGILAFIVSVVVQVIKEMPFLKKIQTNLVTMLTALFFCEAAVPLICMYFHTEITWYYLVAGFFLSFIVYLVSTGGWEKVSEIWKRSRYHGDI